ncbi:hypothetical protein HDE76_000735 [Rhodanobacter sp. ANJX3]|uniref:hypothetical protein n=1 Tax=Rhodanobacter sp. ANJX3 TaxID=2723083 RepID=UPI001613386B|nr:hypothetical protein [Rhodanobacter sp. ANJX3]MBB5357553.1 hypothetical protein [Rhodanobacter sp. ANJX3]
MRNYMEALQHGHPMAAARMVRRERYAWPGGYALALVTTDGGVLCPDCVRDQWASVSWSHRVGCSDGFRPAAVTAECDTDEGVTCDHCSRVIFEGFSDED